MFFALDDDPSEPADTTDFVHIIAPSQHCWKLSFGTTRVDTGCGEESVDVEGTGGQQVFLSTEPSGWWDIGMRIEVNGEIVRDIRSAPYGGLSASYAEDRPENTILVRFMAPDDGCWTATIEDEIRDGCGSLTFPLNVRGDINVVFERTPPAAWTWCLVVEADGKIVQTVGPDSNPDYPLGFWWGPPELSGNPPDLQVEPVTC